MSRIFNILILLIVLVGIVGISSAGSIHADNLVNSISKEKRIAINDFEKIYELFMKVSLPKSLDKQYMDSVPEKMSSKYLFRMFSLGGMFEGITISLQNGDMNNANTFYNNFAKEYKNFTNDVPEWKDYFDTASVDRLGKDIKSGNKKKISEDMIKIGTSCKNCHEDVQSQVWAKYYWKDFDTVNVTGPTGINMPWVDGMFVLASGFDGIGINAQEGNQTGAENSFNLFKTMISNFKDACSNCHSTPRYYFVGNNEMSMIDEIGTNISNGNLAQANILQQQFGENCYKCHVIHIPAQNMKAKMNK